MPKFIKMGLHGTGYLGKKEKSLRAKRRFQARRKVLPGFPINASFKSIEDVRLYLSGESIICLLCGKNYKKLGNHILKIHGMTVEAYKRKYNIPWTYGLICQESSKKYSNAVKKRMKNGWEPPAKIGEDHKKMISVDKRKCKFKAEIAIQNLGDAGKPKHPLTKGPGGRLETFTQRRERKTSKRGTQEFKKKMANRPQCKPENLKKCGFTSYWKGKKQTQEHIAKRFKGKRTIRYDR